MRIRTKASALAAMLALLAGCSGASNGAAAVTWTDDVCAALLGFTTAASAQPQVDPTMPTAAVSQLRDYLATTATALRDTIDGLSAAGPAPVEGGDQFVDRLTDTLTQIRTSFEEAAGRVAQVDTSSVESVAAALPAVVAPLQELSNLADPTEGLQANDELRRAAEQAPNCQRLSAS